MKFVHCFHYIDNRYMLEQEDQTTGIISTLETSLVGSWGEMVVIIAINIGSGGNGTFGNTFARIDPRSTRNQF
jgi:hypothetical protein